MEKIFVVAGELSGDKLGAWYVRRLRKEQPSVEVAAVGGSFLEQEGVELYERFEKLNIVGLVEIIKHARFLLRFLRDLAQQIVANDFSHVVVVDFPGFNLRLIKRLKKLNPEIKITYLSPPQLWAWGERRIKTIKKFCDEVIVLYPFEVEWYASRGVEAQWLGYPFFETIVPATGGFNPLFSGKKKAHIAIMPGSRMVEIKRLLPLFIKVARRLKLAYPKVKIILPLAESIDKSVVEKILRQSAASRWVQDVVIVQGENEKLKALSSCCLALTKPGTVTLELALLGVPAVVAYRASWITYFIAKMLVKISYMSLPSLLLKEQVYPELIQGDCTEKKIWGAVKGMYGSYLRNDEIYVAAQARLQDVRKLLS